MRPDQLDGFASVSEPALAPDGRRVLVTVSRINLEDDRYDRVLHLWDGEVLRPFTAGPGDRLARWSPDGTRIAFLREVDERPQVAVIPADGGEATVVTDAPKGIRDVQWADDDTLVAHWVEWAEGWEDDEGRARLPRRITRLPYKFDTLGWIHDTRHRVTVVDPEGGAEPRHLTDPIERFLSLAVDDDRVLFLADLTDRLVTNLDRALYAVPLAGGDVESVTEPGGWSQVVASPDGPVVVGTPDPDDFPDNQRPYLVTDDGPVPMAPDLDRSTILVFGSPVVPVATDDGLVTLVEDAGRVGLHRVADGAVTEVAGGDRTVTGFSIVGDTVAFTASAPTDPGELWILDVDGERRVTEVNAGVADSLDLVESERFTVDGPGGPIDAWALLPAGDGPAPLLLNIHGGPAAQYGDVFFDEFQIYASAGYGVIACNPRGSSGRGREWVRAVVGDGWGTNDLADIQAVVDAALERYPRLDGERMGVMGGSYGGFMTAWLTAHDQRFGSSVVERALLSFPSFFGTSDIGTTFGTRYVESEMPSGIDVLWEKSPLSVAHQIEAPTLILHSELDHRCPIEQAEQLFTALVVAGTTTEFLRFPGESHELSRSGKPKHRRERFEAILEWHGRWLGTDPGEVAD